MQMRKKKHLVLLQQRKQTTHAQNNATALFRLQRKHKKPKSKNKSIKHQTKYLLINITQKHLNCRENSAAFS